MVGRLVQQQDIRLGRQRSRQQYPALEPSGQRGDVIVDGQAEPGQQVLDRFLHIPGTGGFNDVLAVFQLLEHGGAGLAAHVMRQVMVAPDGLADLPESARDHVEDAAGGFQRDFLIQSGHPYTIRIGNITVIRDDSPVDQLEQRGFAGAIAAHQRYSLTPFQGETNPIQ